MALEQTFESVDDATAALKALREKSEEEIQEEIIDQEEIDEEPDLELEPEEEFDEDQPLPAIEAPVGYQDVWEDLEPHQQGVIAKQAKEASAAVTRSTEELANVRKEREQESQSFAEERARLAALMEKLTEVPEEPDPDLLDPASDKYDPDEYNKIQASRKRALKKAESVQEELNKHQEEQQVEEQTALAESQKIRNEYLAKEWPEVLDPVKGPALQQGVLEYAQSLGMNLEVMPYLTGPMLQALDESRRYKELKKKSVKKRSPRSVRPSAPSSPARKRTKQLDQLKKAALESGDEKKILDFMKQNRAAARR